MILKLALILIPFCNAEIRLEVTVASNKNEVKVEYSGEANKLITDHEIELFNVSISNLNRAIRVELGRVPDGVYLKDPTPYGNLFHKYKWPEVKRNLRIYNVEIEDVITKEEVLKTHEHDNNSTEDTLSERSLIANVEDNVFAEWSAKGLPAEDIFYNLTINFANSSLKYERKWRDRGLKAFFTQIGKADSRTITLKPGKGIVKKLKALKTIIVLHVDYRATLTGNLIADYENLYGKYHFYAPTINNIMRAGGLMNEIMTRERVEIRCYTDPKLEIFDRDSGAPVRFRRKLLWKNLDRLWVTKP